MAERNSMPWGDAFLVQTPTLDRWSQQMYIEQKQRQAKQQQEDALLDANLQKEIGKVRSVDTPDVIQAYHDYKQGRKQLLFNKQLQKDPLAFNQAQQKVLQDYQRVFATANKSAEVKEMTKNLGSIGGSDRADDYGQRLNTLMNTPVSQLQNHPVYGNELLDVDKYRYSGMNTDFGKMLKEAVGTTKKYYGKEVPIEGGLQYKTPVFEYANKPSQVKDYLIGAMAMRQAGKDAAWQWDHTPEKEIEETIKSYQAIPKDYWEKIGEKEPQNLMPKNPDNKAENYASLLAMKDAISRAPIEGKPDIRRDEAAIMKAQEAKNIQMEAIRHANAKDLIDYKKKIDPNDTELNNIWYESYLDKVMSDAKSSGERHHIYNPDTGKSDTYYNMIRPDPFLLKSFSIGNVSPDRMGVTEKGELLPIFFQYDSKGNLKTIGEKKTPLLNNDYSLPMAREQALVNLGYRGSTKKQFKEDQEKIQNRQNKVPAVKETKHHDPLGLF